MFNKNQELLKGKQAYCLSPIHCTNIQEIFVKKTLTMEIQPLYNAVNVKKKNLTKQNLHSTLVMVRYGITLHWSPSCYMQYCVIKRANCTSILQWNSINRQPLSQCYIIMQHARNQLWQISTLDMIVIYQRNLKGLLWCQMASMKHGDVLTWTQLDTAKVLCAGIPPVTCWFRKVPVVQNSDSFFVFDLNMLQNKQLISE